MALLIHVFSFLLLVSGILFIVGYQQQTVRLIIGLVLIAGGFLLLATMRLRPKDNTFVHSTQELKCKNCGSTLTNKSVTVRAETIFISCKFCGTQYQLEEAPKW